jgi:hypothetical protein
MKKTRELQAQDLVIPIWKAILAIAVYAVIVLLLWLLYLVVKADILGDAVKVLFKLLSLAFLLALLSSYGSHFSRIRDVSLLTPGLTALSSAIVFYFIATLLSELNKSIGVAFIDTICSAVIENIILLFVIFLTLGYIFHLVKRLK